MIVYHGSSLEVTTPDIRHSRDNVDFGKGFYVTPIKEQAENGLLLSPPAEAVPTKAAKVRKSDGSEYMSEGISDMHCQSDAYLAQELMDEYRLTAEKNNLQTDK